MGTGTSEVRAARRERIRRFAAAQEKRRRFVRLAELAEHRARKIDEALGANKDRLHYAFLGLGESILKGEFEDKGMKPPPAWLRSPAEETSRPQKEGAPSEYRFRVIGARHPQPWWAMDAPDWAEPYLRRAHCGLSTPDEIDAEIAAKGLPPLTFTPDTGSFDPMAHPWWTLPMAAAWIIWRTPHAVTRVWPDYRRKVRKWVGPRRIAIWDEAAEARSYGYRARKTEIVTGYALGRLDDLHLLDVLLRAELGDPKDGAPVLSGEATRAQLWARLQSGALIAEGVRHPGSERAPMRDAEWIDLDPYYHNDWPTNSIGKQFEANPRFTGLCVRSADVLRLWPPPGAADGPTPAGDQSERLERERLKDFKRPEWTLGQTLSWIAYRDRDRFGCFSDRRSTLVLFYKHPPEPALLDPECQTTLRSALVEGRMVAIRDHQPVPREKWVGSSLWDFEGAWFRRIDVLSLWPELDSEASQVPDAADAAANPGGGSQLQGAIQRAYSQLWPEGPPEGLMVQERDARIIAVLKENGLRAPSSQTIYRALKPPTQKRRR